MYFYEMTETNVKIKKKRGRKSKKELEELKKQGFDSLTQKKIPKKRGRKPKGGKVVEVKSELNDKNDTKENIILHLRCSSDQLEQSNFLSDLSYKPNIEKIKAYNSCENIISTNKYFNIEVSNFNGEQSNKNNIHYNNNNGNHNNSNNNNNNLKDKNEINIQEVWNKIKILQHKLHTNNISDKKSDCFWCTCGFDNPPIYIPKNELNGTYEVYGCFCSPECAVAYLCDENIDSSIKWERYSLLNNIYKNIYNYSKNIKPAPSPYYLLDKYYGNMSIEEYRRLFRHNNLLLVVDKPLTRILPEIFEDNNEYSIKPQETNKKYKLSRNKPTINKIQTDKNWLF